MEREIKRSEDGEWRGGGQEDRKQALEDDGGWGGQKNKIKQAL